jgi:hypothetical protein
MPELTMLIEEFENLHSKYVLTRTGNATSLARSRSLYDSLKPALLFPCPIVIL